MTADELTLSPPYAPQAESLAKSALHLRGPELRVFVEQFSALASRPVAVRIAGDGETFRQALCFPTLGTAYKDSFNALPSAAPHVLVELANRHLVCLRLGDCAAGRVSVGAILRSIEHSLERLPQGMSAWSGIQKSIEMMSRRRVVLVDFVLEADLDLFWQTYFPRGDAVLAGSLFQGMTSIPLTARKQALTAMLDIQSDHYRSAVADFLQALDAEVIQAIRSSGLPPSVSRYNTYRRGEATAARYRIQAAEAIPLMGYLLGEETHSATRLRRLVDAGQPLWPALADTVGVPEETVRWLRGKTADDISEAWLGRIPDLLRSLAELPSPKRPKSRDDWTAYTDFALVLNKAHLSKRQSGWLQDLARIGWVAARQKFDGLGAAPSDLLDIADLLREIAGAVAGELMPYLPLYGYREYPEWQRVEDAVAAEFLDISVLKQIRTSLRWHALQLQPPVEEAMEDAEGVAKEPPARFDHWPAPFTEPRKVAGLHIHFLTTPALLRDEGLRMEHCVGSYADRCLFDGTNIVSLRRDDGRSVSTAELRMAPKGKQLGFEVVQHKAYRNGCPPAEAAQALSRLLPLLAADDMQPRLIEMREQLKHRQSLDDRRREWLAETPRAPHRLRALKAALKLHVGYERFLEAGQRVMEW